MSTRKLDEIATDLDDAAEIVEELKDTPGEDDDEKLDDLHKIIEEASDTMDELEENDEQVRKQSPRSLSAAGPTTP
jgi:hypothetical protein